MSIGGAAAEMRTSVFDQGWRRCECPLSARPMSFIWRRGVIDCGLLFGEIWQSWICSSSRRLTGMAKVLASRVTGGVGERTHEPRNYYHQGEQK